MWLYYYPEIAIEELQLAIYISRHTVTTDLVITEIMRNRNDSSLIFLPCWLSSVEYNQSSNFPIKKICLP